MSYKKSEKKAKTLEDDNVINIEDGKKCCCKEHNKENCKCKDEQQNEECKCENKCKDSECDCEENEECCCKNKNDDLADEYLNMARRVQAEFDNYRKRTSESLKQAKTDGVISALEVILPSLDVFKKAKGMIKDENSLKGIEMVENEINNSLSSLGVKKIETKNAQFDPKLHNALAVIEDKTKPNNCIIEEYQTGYQIDDKVIKYSQVIVNKLKEDK